MNSRERLLIALDGGEPDRVPCALGFYRVETGSFASDTRQQTRLVDVDFVHFPLSPAQKKLRKTANPYSPDTRLGNVYQIATYKRWRYRPQKPRRRNPLARAVSFDELKSFPFPDQGGPYRLRFLNRQVEETHRQGLASAGNLPHLGGELFETAWRLRGLENFLLDLVERAEWAHFLLDRLTDFAQHNAETLARAGVDVLVIDDDVGMPGTMMISPDMWRQFFKPRLSKIIRSARSIKPELRILFHSDGYYTPIIGDLVEIGVNAINPVQPEHMDADSIRREFGNSLALWGTVGRQTTFSLGSPDGIREEVRGRIETLGRSALVLCPAYDIDEPDVRKENVAAFLTAVEAFG